MSIITSAVTGSGCVAAFSFVYDIVTFASFCTGNSVPSGTVPLTVTFAFIVTTIPPTVWLSNTVCSPSIGIIILFPSTVIFVWSTCNSFFSANNALAATSVISVTSSGNCNVITGCLNRYVSGVPVANFTWNSTSFVFFVDNIFPFVIVSSAGFVVGSFNSVYTSAIEPISSLFVVVFISVFITFKFCIVSLLNPASPIIAFCAVIAIVPSFTGLLVVIVMLCEFN